MTYVPVRPEEHSGTGRTPLDIPPALISQLQHSRSTGERARIELDGTEDPADIADLKRALIRAGYRHFGEHSIYKRFRPTFIEFWVGPKKPRGTKRETGRDDD